MTAFDWRPHILSLIEVKQAIDDHDRLRRWQYTFPSVAASETQIQSVEQALGLRIEPGYRGFLRYANGWRSFFQGVHLFGVEQLIEGSLRDSANELISGYDDAFFRHLGAPREAIVPIAVSPEDKDLFVMVKQGSLLSTPVIWLAGEMVERFESFEQFFQSMLEYSKHDFHDIVAEFSPKGSKGSRQ